MVSMHPRSRSCRSGEHVAEEMQINRGRDAKRTRLRENQAMAWTTRCACKPAGRQHAGGVRGMTESTWRGDGAVQRQESVSRDILQDAFRETPKGRMRTTIPHRKLLCTRRHIHYCFHTKHDLLIHRLQLER